MPKVIDQRRYERIIDDTGQPTYRFIRFLEELTGNSNSMLSDLSGLNEFDDLFKDSAFEQLKNDIAIVSLDHEAVANQTVICTASITVLLPPEPDDQERVRIQGTRGKVIIDGNGHNTNGETDTIMRRNYTAWDFMFIAELDEWIIV